MTSARRISAAALLSALLLSACGGAGGQQAPVQQTSAGGAGTQEQTETAAETETDYYGGIREAADKADFGGGEFRFISYDDDGYWQIYLYVGEENGDVLNDAAYRRNLEVEEMLSVKISQLRDADSEGKFKKSVQSGSDDYDMLCFWAVGNFSGFISNNLVLDWKTLPHVDLSAPWYNQTANDAYTIGGRQYFGVGDITFPVHQHFRLLMNKSLVTDLGLELPYQAVRDGKWTFDMMLDYISAAYGDLNGDGAADAGDRYGLATNHAYSAAFVWNAGELQVYPEENGFRFNLNSDRIQRIVDSIVSLRDNPNVYYTNDNTHYDPFWAGNVMFLGYGSDPLLLRDKEVDIGYLAYPKYDEAQDDYYVWSDGGMMTLPKTCSDTARTGLIIEAMSAASNKYVKEAFISKYIENKILRDEDSVAIYRMMRDRATYDLSFNIDPSNKLTNYGYYGYFMQKKTTDLASYYAKNESKIVSKYQELFDAAVNG